MIFWILGATFELWATFQTSWNLISDFRTIGTLFEPWRRFLLSWESGSFEDSADFRTTGSLFEPWKRFLHSWESILSSELIFGLLGAFLSPIDVFCIPGSQFWALSRFSNYWSFFEPWRRFLHCWESVLSFELWADFRTIGSLLWAL